MNGREEQLEEQRLKRWEKTHKIIDGVDHKLCNRCNGYFPANEEYFYINKSNKTDGLYPYCIECGILKSMIWIENNRIRHNENKNKSRSRHVESHHEYNKEFSIHYPEYLNEWYSNNPDKRKEYFAKRNALKKHEISEDEWAACKNYFNNSCAYCGKDEGTQRYENDEDFHREHVDDDGANDISNCVPSCTNCNSQKWKHEFEIWYNVNNKCYSEDRKRKIDRWLTNDYKLIIKT